jgi:hypothetical protein
MDQPPQLAQLVELRIAELEGLGWRRLVEHEGDAIHEPIELGGTAYVLESQVFWDNRKGGALRIIVDVYRDDGSVFSRSVVVTDRIVRRPATVEDLPQPDVPVLRTYARRLRAALRRR